jgi:hypothetical protein
MKKAISIILLTVTACAQQQPQQKQVYVSPQEFQKYNCKQIAKDLERTSAQYQQITAGQQGNDVMQTALAAYMVSQRYAFKTSKSEDPQAAYLKAKYDALQQAAIEKNCN